MVIPSMTSTLHFSIYISFQQDEAELSVRELTTWLTICPLPDTDTLAASMGIFFLTSLLHAKVATLHGICESVLLCTIIRHNQNSVASRSA